MTSKEDGKAAPGEERRRSPLDHLPPPANSNKPLTPFSIEDILNKPSVRRSYSLCGAAHLLAAADKHAPGGLPLAGRALLSQTSPLCALEELASKTFKGLEVSVLQAAEGRRRRWVLLRPAPHYPLPVPHSLCPVPLPTSSHACRQGPPAQAAAAGSGNEWDRTQTLFPRDLWIGPCRVTQEGWREPKISAVCLLCLAPSRSQWPGRSSPCSSVGEQRAFQLGLFG